MRAAFQKEAMCLLLLVNTLPFQALLLAMPPRPDLDQQLERHLVARPYLTQVLRHISYVRMPILDVIRVRW